MIRRNSHRWLWGGVGMVLLVAVLITSVGKSFNFPALLPDRYSGDSWCLVFAYGGLGKVLLQSLLISVVVSIISTFLAFAVGFKWRKANTTGSLIAFYLPYLISPIVFAVCLQVWMLRLDIAGEIWGVILGQLCIAFPYAVILQSGIWNEELFQRIDLSRNLGAKPGFIIEKVIMPVAQSIIVLCLIQTFLISWFDFAFVQMLGMGQVKTMTLVLYQSVLETDLSIAAVCALLIFLPPAVLFSLNYKTLNKQWKP